MSGQKHHLSIAISLKQTHQEIARRSICIIPWTTQAQFQMPYSFTIESKEHSDAFFFFPLKTLEAEWDFTRSSTWVCNICCCEQKKKLFLNAAAGHKTWISLITMLCTERVSYPSVRETAWKQVINTLIMSCSSRGCSSCRYLQSFNHSWRLSSSW
jgi:hypothetical protein